MDKDAITIDKITIKFVCPVNGQSIKGMEIILMLAGINYCRDAGTHLARGSSFF